MPALADLRPARPAPQRIGDLAALLGVPAPPGAAETTVTGVTLDSRSVHPGDLYAALPGARAHGAGFAPAAVAAGAVAVLTDPTGAAAAAAAGVPVLVVEAPRARLGAVAVAVYGDPAGALSVLGITGTNGKTTVGYLLEAGLRAAGRSTGLIGTVQTCIAGQCLPSIRTTPEAPDLQSLLAVMRERQVDAVAMEVSSHALALHRVDGTRFTVGAFTNLSQDHLDFHADLEDYFQAKAKLFDGRCEHEVVNVDDAHGRRLVRPGTVTVSAEGAADAQWRALDIRPAATGGSHFQVVGPGGLELSATVGLAGRFNVANALLALAVIGTAGIDPRSAAAGLASAVVPGRMEAVRAGQPFRAIVDYAHTPAAVRTLLTSLHPFTGGRLIVVLGCGGDRDQGKRPLMGAAAARHADLLLITDDNPRSEDPDRIRAALAAGANQVPPAQRAQVRVVPDRRAAIADAVRSAGPQDTVVVAGKGHEQGQEIGAVVHPFDDRVALRELIGTLTR